jgi:hypothetical protein
MDELTPRKLSSNELERADSSGEGPFRRKPRFTSLRGVRREYGALYLDLLNGRVAQKVAGTAGTLLNGIVKALEVEILEARLAELELRARITPAMRSERMRLPRIVGHA